MGLELRPVATAGLHAVPLAQPDSTRLALGASLGYGQIESLEGAPGTHRRLLGHVAAAAALRPGLTVSLFERVQRDWHGVDSEGHDRGTLLTPGLELRYERRFGAADPSGSLFAPWGAGLSLGAEVPPGADVGESLGATSPSLRGFVDHRRGAWRVASLLGARWDRSAAVGDAAARWRAGDRLASGLSDYDALLLGLGAGWQRGRLLAFVELSGDWLLGNSAPPVGESPWRASLGARWGLRPDLVGELSLTTSLSSRPAQGPQEPLVPVEPRWLISLGVVSHWGYSAAPAPAAVASSPPPATATKAARVAPQDPRPLRVEVSDPHGDAIGHAHVFLEQGTHSEELEPLELGVYSLQTPWLGEATLRVEAVGFASERRELTLARGELQGQAVHLQPQLGGGQVRGLIRSFGGKGLQATVTVEPGHRLVHSDAEGNFSLDLPPGRYEVRIQAVGYAGYTRSVTIESNGVVVVNADLQQ